ncbi:MAG: biotin/lipoyl-containing protein [Armatimonadota bacterium]|nr:biotin/lipoyl-containing protein [Armatimonadota bacterium]
MRLEVTTPARRLVVDVEPSGDQLAVRTDDTVTLVRLQPAAGSECWRLHLEGRAVPVRLHPEDGGVLVVIGAGRARLGLRRALPIPSRGAARPAATERVEVRAPMPGLVVALPLIEGASVQAGAPVAVVEAMKMQMEVPSPAAGRIREVRARPGQEVAGGQVLVVVEAEDPQR